MSSQLKPPEHYGREAHIMLDGMREAIRDDPALPDALAAEVATTMERLRANIEAVETGEYPDA